MKSLINTALLKEQLKRFWAIGALALLQYTLFVITPLWSRIADRDAMFAAESIVRIITMRDVLIQMVGVLVPFAAALSLFSYLYQPKSTAAMHSYPLSKKQLFFTNMAAGLLLCAIPLFILCLGLLSPVVWQLPEMRTVQATGEVVFDGFLANLPVELFPNGLAEGSVINSVPIIAGFFFRALLTNVFYLVIFSLAVMVTGNAVVSLLMCGLLPLIPSALMLLGYITGNFYFFGFETIWFDEAMLKVFTFTNPVMLSSAFNFYYPQYPDAEIPLATNLVLYYGVYIVIAAVLFALAYWCSCVRKQERAGDSVVFVPLKNVLVFLLSTAGMIFLGAFFLGMLGSVALMYAGLVFGFIIVYFISQMIAEKTFGVMYKAKGILKYGGIMTWIIVTIVIVSKADLGGYQTYLPEPEEVYGVYLHQPYTMDYRNEGYGDEYRKSFFITDEKVIFDTLQAHGKIIGDRHSLRSTFLRSLEGNSMELGISEQYFMYRLKNGKTVARRYALTQDYMKESGVVALLSESDVILSRYGTFRTPEQLDSVALQYNEVPEEAYGDPKAAEMARTMSNVYFESILIEDAEDIISVLEEIKKDIVISEQMRLSQDKAYYTSWSAGISGNTERMTRSQYWMGDHFSLYSYENVDNWLESRGLKPEPQTRD